MATIKHLASKNANYDRSLEYLLFEHSRSGTPLKDDEGNMIPRKECILEGINCTPYTFDLECRQLNWAYQKNQEHDDIKSHHYILSFDPKDKEEGLLNPERAQRIGMEFARRCFPGHQTLVCTHGDGHNRSGNIHCHIIFNSLRKLDVEKQPFMERDIDSRAGYKHNLTPRYLQFLQKEVMRLCEKEGLHQVDLLSPATVKITDAEYHTGRRGQEKLDERNAQIVAMQMIPRRTVFQTQKQYLRDAITEAASLASSQEEFQKILWEKYKIELKDRRGRFSYLHPQRKKYITGRSLGTDFEKGHLLDKIHRNFIDQSFYAPYDPAHDYHADPVAILYVRSEFHLVTDLQTELRAQINAAYTRKIRINNLQEMARTVLFIQECGYDSRQDLARDLTSYKDRAADMESNLQNTKELLRQSNESLHYTGQYYANRSFQSDFLKSWNKGKYRAVHREELNRYDEAVEFFHEHTGGKIPSINELHARKLSLIETKAHQETELKTLRQVEQKLSIALANVDAILSSGPSLGQEPVAHSFSGLNQNPSPGQDFSPSATDQDKVSQEASVPNQVARKEKREPHRKPPRGMEL